MVLARSPIVALSSHRWTPLKAIFLQLEKIQRTFEQFSRVMKLIQEVCGLYQEFVLLIECFVTSLGFLKQP